MFGDQETEPGGARTSVTNRHPTLTDICGEFGNGETRDDWLARLLCSSRSNISLVGRMSLPGTLESVVVALQDVKFGARLEQFANNERVIVDAR
jgi:hypothetical protein